MNLIRVPVTCSYTTCLTPPPPLLPRVAEEHKLKGNVAYKAGRYEEACQHYTQAIHHNPNSATYWSNRSAALMMLHKFSEALDDCTQATKLDESYTKVRWLSLMVPLYFLTPSVCLFVCLSLCLSVCRATCVQPNAT